MRRLTLLLALCAVSVPLASASVHLPGQSHHHHHRDAARHHRHHHQHRLAAHRHSSGGAAHHRPSPDDVVGSVRLAASRYGLSPDGMLRVARCESNLQRAATNGQYLGLFQLGAYAREHYLRGSWTDAYANATAAARYAHDAGGWGPWTCGTTY